MFKSTSVRRELEADYKRYQSRIDGEVSKILGVAVRIDWVSEDVSAIPLDELERIVQEMRDVLRELGRWQQIMTKINLLFGDYDGTGRS